jgi:hypothetical protein
MGHTVKPIIHNVTARISCLQPSELGLVVAGVQTRRIFHFSISHSTVQPQVLRVSRESHSCATPRTPCRRRRRRCRRWARRSRRWHHCSISNIYCTSAVYSHTRWTAPACRLRLFLALQRPSKRVPCRVRGIAVMAFPLLGGNFPSVRNPRSSCHRSCRRIK